MDAALTLQTLDGRSRRFLVTIERAECDKLSSQGRETCPILVTFSNAKELDESACQFIEFFAEMPGVCWLDPISNEFVRCRLEQSHLRRFGCNAQVKWSHVRFVW